MWYDAMNIELPPAVCARMSQAHQARARINHQQHHEIDDSDDARASTIRLTWEYDDEDEASEPRERRMMGTCCSPPATRRQFEEIYHFSLTVKEYQIIHFFLPKLKDELMKTMPAQKQTCACLRTRIRVFVAIDDLNGHVGLGLKCAKEVATAIILARLSLIPVRRGYWGTTSLAAVEDCYTQRQRTDERFFARFRADYDTVRVPRARSLARCTRLRPIPLRLATHSCIPRAQRIVST
ncbi:hypothetical protein L227DRAFT_565724 [Lentinus tigrinus ALCF2SS1-6]|uniref:S5 DRBM domain-containing protein n=1 Tax=Lentinus tigrinus ALCF2SS1-6 TaxID=1328759 RepID=A0A5C2S0X5_9APHY|nr:hypothetical protein L227DRAFT_565724 [Lentinus tigrinus ALCF2SS1-6]